MSDAFLEDQLRRIRQLTERMSRITQRNDSEGISTERYAAHGPLHDVRDMRIVNSVPVPKASASDAPLRRPRRRRR